MTKICHNHKSQTNPQQRRRGEANKNNSNMAFIRNKGKQSALFPGEMILESK